jgi:UDP-glucose 6-dehydrogenase
MKIGCIGQGFVGFNISNDLENRGFSVVRYSLESNYIANKDLILECELVFIAVPTPSTPEGFDFSRIEAVIPLTAEGSTVVIKSTVLPGTTQFLQDKYPDRVFIFCPEFLSEMTAVSDAANPILNIIGLPKTTQNNLFHAEKIKIILPKSPHNFVVSAEAAEIFKYTHNIHGYMRILLANLVFEIANKTNVDWSQIKDMMDNDPMMSEFYNLPNHKGGRGAGGNCFIKDMRAFNEFYTSTVPDDSVGKAMLDAMEAKNIDLLLKSGKDVPLLKSVYGSEINTKIEK